MKMSPTHLPALKRTQTFIDTCWPEMSIVSQHSTSNAMGEGSSRFAALNLSFNHSIDKMLTFEREYIFEPAKLDKSLLRSCRAGTNSVRLGITQSLRLPDTIGMASGMTKSVLISLKDMVLQLGAKVRAS